MGRRQQTAGEEDCSGKAVPEAPEPLMADIRLQAIKRQDDPALGLGNPLEAGRVRQREREQCVVAFTQMRDRPRGDGDAPIEPVLMHVRNTTMLRLAQRAHPRDDIQAKLVLGQSQPSFFFWAVGAAELWTGPVETAPAVQGEMHHVCQGRARTLGMLGGPHRLTAEGAMTPKRLEGAGCCGSRTRRRTCHGESFP